MKKLTRIWFRMSAAKWPALVVWGRIRTRNDELVGDKLWLHICIPPSSPYRKELHSVLPVKCLTSRIGHVRNRWGVSQTRIWKCFSLHEPCRVAITLGGNPARARSTQSHKRKGAFCCINHSTSESPIKTPLTSVLNEKVIFMWLCRKKGYVSKLTHKFLKQLHQE